MNILKVGDVIYRLYHNRITDKLVIERTTKTQAISGNYKFNIEYGSWINLIGGKGTFCSYSIATKELDIEYRKNQIKKVIEKIDYSKIELSKLEQIVSVLDCL